MAAKKSAKKQAKKPAKKPAAKKQAKKPAKKPAAKKPAAKKPAAPVSPDTRNPRQLQRATNKHPELKTLPEVRAYLAGVADGRKKGGR